MINPITTVTLIILKKSSSLCVIITNLPKSYTYNDFHSLQVYVRHPELAAAKANRDYVLKQVCEAVNTISDVAQGKGPQNPHHNFEGPGELAAALDDFDEHMVMDPLAYNEVCTRPSLEERLESIISGAALMADSSCTRDERRERIVAECNAVRQALQDLLSEYMSNVSIDVYYLNFHNLNLTHNN